MSVCTSSYRLGCTTGFIKKMCHFGNELMSNNTVYRGVPGKDSKSVKYHNKLRVI